MTKKPASSKKDIQVTISGGVNGQVAVGENISQQQQVGVTAVSAAELAEFRELLKQLQAKIISETPPDKKEAALERVQELEQAITEEKPDLSTMEYVKNWFGKNVPALAGAVTSVVVHPIVGRLVETGGDLLVSEFQRRFGSSS